MKRLLSVPKLAMAAAVFIFPARLLAVLVSSGPLNISIPTTYAGVYVDIDTFATAGAEFAGWDVNFAFGGSEIYNSDKFQAVRAGTSYDSAYLNLSSGYTVGPSSASYSSGYGGSLTHLGDSLSSFAPGGVGSIAFSFMTNTGAGPYYGWMRVKLTANTPGGVIYDWVFDDSGAPTVIPEPACSVGLVSILILGLSTFLRPLNRRITRSSTEYRLGAQK